MKCFHPTLRITKSCYRAVPDDKFEVQNDPTCTKIGFSTSALPRGDRKWRKGTTKFSCSRLAVDISRCRASNCAGKPPVSMRRSVPRYRARKKGGCIGRKQESIFKAGGWDVHFVKSAKQNFCVSPGYIPARATGRHVTRCEAAENKFFLFSF